MSSLLARLILCVLLINVVAAHYYWFEMPGAFKFHDGSDIPVDDEPLQMQKRFRVKYLRQMARLNPDKL